MQTHVASRTVQLDLTNRVTDHRPPNGVFVARNAAEKIVQLLYAAFQSAPHAFSCLESDSQLGRERYGAQQWADVHVEEFGLGRWVEDRDDDVTLQVSGIVGIVECLEVLNCLIRMDELEGCVPKVKYPVFVSELTAGLMQRREVATALVVGTLNSVDGDCPCLAATSVDHVANFWKCELLASVMIAIADHQEVKAGRIAKGTWCVQVCCR